MSRGIDDLRFAIYERFVRSVPVATVASSIENRKS